MLTKHTIIDQITIGEDKTIFVRHATSIIDDGIEISKTYHRDSFTPGIDVSDQDQSIIDIANLVWTQEVIDAYRQKIQNLATQSGQ